MEASGLPHATAIEYAVSPETFRRRTSASGGYIYPSYFSRIKNGKKLPGKRLVEKTEIAFPGTKYWFEHPFWDVIRHPNLTPSPNLFFTNLLPSKYANAVFNPPQHIDKSGLFITYVTAVCEGLQQSSDLDSLTAAIWIMRFSRKQEGYESKSANYLSDLILRIFMRLASQSPFWNISTELFEYINKHFLEFSEDNQWAQVINEGKVGVYIGYNRIILNLIDELGLLENHSRAPASCLEVVGHHIDPIFLGEISELDTTFDRDKIKRMRKIKALTHDLSEWEESELSRQG